ncbi:MAG: alpha-L-fucosidase, partial [Planctomycetaceae bacterium]|nr:alpha-L-fucosidase [Planctomycetaceae bacterium]
MKKSNRRQFLKFAAKSAGVVAAGISVAQIVPQLDANENESASESDNIAKSDNTLSELVKKDRARNIVLPKNDAHWKPVADYANEPLDNDYVHAPEAAHEAFRDVKYSIRIHWGVYSIWKGEASYAGYFKTSPKQKMEYQQLYKQFNPTGFDADKWTDWFKRCGMQG